MAPATALSLERLCLAVGACCLLPSLLRVELVFELPRVLARWCVHSLEGCIAKAVYLSCLRNMHFLGSTVLLWLTTVLPRELRTVLPHPAR